MLLYVRQIAVFLILSLFWTCFTPAGAIAEKSTSLDRIEYNTTNPIAMHHSVLCNFESWLYQYVVFGHWVV